MGQASEVLDDVAAQLLNRLLDGNPPGGATPASFMSYGVGRTSPDGAKFGTGQLEGVGRARDRGACLRDFRVVADVRARHRLADRGGAVGGC